jgi:adenylate/nucleoside-diphosphate kinase
VIDYANTPPLQILLISKPRSGRTTFARSLAKRLDLEHVDLERPIARLFEKVKDSEENPKTDDDGNPVDPFTPLERSVLEILKSGGEIPTLAL